MADPVTMLMVGSTALSIGSTLVQGEAAHQAGKYEGKQLEQQATARYAAGTREAHESRQATERILSNARAAQAASGGVTTDPGAIEQLGKLGQRGKYNELAALYEAETESAGLRAQAEARRKAGKDARKASRTKALSTALMAGSRYKSGGNDGGGYDPRLDTSSTTRYP